MRENHLAGAAAAAGASANAARRMPALPDLPPHHGKLPAIQPGPMTGATRAVSRGGLRLLLVGPPHYARFAPIAARDPPVREPARS